MSAVGGVVYWYVWTPTAGIDVRIATARNVQQTKNENTVLDATGYVVARRQTTVSSQTTGKVKEVLVEEGMQVSEGQLLATLDDQLQQSQFALANAQHEEALASLVELDINIKHARLDLARVQELVEKSLVSVDEVDQSQLHLDGLIAQRQYAEKGIAVATAALELQQQQLEELKIRAPFAGIVIAKAAQPGEMISPVSGGGGFTRTGICTIVDMDSIEVQVDVNEKFINRVKPKQPVTVTLNSYPETRLPAEVIAIIPTADRARATVRVRIAFLDKDNRVLPDMGVSVSFLEEGVTVVREDLPQGVSVPASAILSQGENYAVWVIDNDSVVYRPVEVDSITKDRAFILSGLQSGESIVINVDQTPATELRHQSRINVLAN